MSNINLETRLDKNGNPALIIKVDPLTKGGDAEIFFQFLTKYAKDHSLLKISIDQESELAVNRYELPIANQQVDSEFLDLNKVPNGYKKTYLNLSLFFFTPDHHSMIPETMKAE